MKKTNAFANFIDEKYIPLNGKMKTGIAVALFLLPLILFYFLWLQPYNTTSTSLSQQKATLMKAIKTAKTRKAEGPKLQAELDKTRKSFEEKSKLLPKEKEIPSLLTNISALGRGSGLDFLSFKPSSIIPKDFYSEIPIDITVRGPYHNMGVFLDQVSKLDRIVTVANITMGSPKKEGAEMLLQSKCRLVTYQFTNIELSSSKDKKK
jgi:type IV pilus assembly protein PilO